MKGQRTAMAAAMLAAAMAMALSPPTFATEAIPKLPISVAIADEAADGSVHPAQSTEWIDAQIEEATRLFTAHASIRFGKTESRAVDARHAHLETRADRDALAAYLRPGVINVFVVASLRDVDEPERMRMGVCWSPRGEREKASEKASRFVILSAIAKPTVLAHELGHYHGLPHSQVRNNVMSYDRDGGPVFFDAAQSRTMRASASAYIRDGVLVPR